jgi:flagellar FliL protein
MADEQTEGEGGEVKAGGGLKALLVPIISSAVTAGIVGAVVVTVMAPKAPTAEEAAASGGHGEKAEGGHGESSSGSSEPSDQDSKKQSGIYMNYDPFIVSIFDREKVHYLKIVLSLELMSEAVKEEITAKNPQVRDNLIFVLSDFTLRELLDNQAKTMLKEVLIKTLNKILGPGKILNIYFTEFTIQ